MVQNNLIETAKKFWEFFSDIAKQIQKSPEDNNLINNLDSAVDRLGVYGWEYGPYELNNDWYFCLSPNLRDDLLEELQFVISLAPKLRGWHFFVGKPKKMEEINCIDVVVDEYDIQEVCADNWRCVLYKMKNGKYDIDICLDKELNNFTEDDKYNIVETFLIHMLGEVGYMSLIDKVFIVETLEKEGIRFLDLRYFFGSVTG